MGSSLDDFDPVAKAVDVDGRAVLRPTETLRARYLLVWLTSVPVADGSRYRGAIAEVAVRRVTGALEPRRLTCRPNLGGRPTGARHGQGGTRGSGRVGRGG